MSQLIRFVPRNTLDAQTNLAQFVELVRTRLPPLLERNEFDADAWSVEGLEAKGNPGNFIYFCQLGVRARKFFSKPRSDGRPAQIPATLLMREPLRAFAKAMLAYLHVWKRATIIRQRLAAFKFLEAALLEITGGTCPTATTPEVLDRACALSRETTGQSATYGHATALRIVYEMMGELGLLAVPSTWVPPVRPPVSNRNRVGEKFDAERMKKLPSPLALEALAAIFNSDSEDPTEIFTSSICALMLCTPDRSVEVLYAPRDLIAAEWKDPDTGETGLALRWFPAKGATPQTKTVIPAMREVVIRAVERLKRLSEPARALALWYERNPNRLYLPTEFEYLRERERIEMEEIYSILYGAPVEELDKTMSNRAVRWLTANKVPYVAAKSRYDKQSSADFKEFERAVLATLPSGFPVMDRKTGMHYSEALCLARPNEFNSKTSPQQCTFDRINYSVLQDSLKSQGDHKSIFEKREYRDSDGNILSMTTHQMRHYLNTLVRHSGKVTEDEIALWSGRKSVRQNATYNHVSDRDVIAKCRLAVGDPSRAVGPFANMDKRVFTNRSEFAGIKIITAHTHEFGCCIHDYAQSPCPCHTDCIHCNDSVCIKGDRRAEKNLRAFQQELTRLVADAQAAFDDEVLGSAEWFEHQSKTLELVNALVAILDDPNVPDGAVIQLSGVVSPSRLTMAREKRALAIKPVSHSISSLEDVRVLLRDQERAAGANPNAC